jgi:hypothetical protein
MSNNTKTRRGIGGLSLYLRLLINLLLPYFMSEKYMSEMIKKAIARSPIMMVKIKALSFSILRISYSTLFAIFSCSAIAKLEIVGRSSFVINFTYGLFEQTTDLKLSAPVVLFARYF